MQQGSWRLWAPLAGVLTASLWLAGCGGGGTSPALTTDPTTALAQSTTQALQGALPVGGSAITETDGATGDDVADLLEPSESKRSSVITVTIDKITPKGLHVVGTWTRTYDTSTKTLTITGNVTATGTISDPGQTDNGNVVNMTKTANLINSSGTVEVAGTVTKAGVVYTLDDKRVVSHAGTVVSVNNIKTEMAGTVTLYAKNVTESTNLGVARPADMYTRPHTINGTITWSNLAMTDTLTIQYSGLQYEYDVPQDVLYQAGSMVVTHVVTTATATTTTVTNLTAGSNVLSGPIVQNGTQIGTLTISGAWAAAAIPKK